MREVEPSGTIDDWLHAALDGDDGAWRPQRPRRG